MVIPLSFFFKTLFAPHPQDRQRMHRTGQTHELHNLCEAATPRDGGFLRTPRDPKRIKHVKVPLDIAMVLKNNYGATLIWIYLSKNSFFIRKNITHCVFSDISMFFFWSRLVKHQGTYHLGDVGVATSTPKGIGL